MLEIILAAGAGRSVTKAVPCPHLSVMGGTGDTSVVAPLVPAWGFGSSTLGHKEAPLQAQLTWETLQMTGGHPGRWQPLGHPQKR